MDNMENRLCRKCGKIKPFDQFESYIHKKTDKIYTRHICRECHYKRHIEYKRRKRRERFKGKKQCPQCGEWKNFRKFKLSKICSECFNEYRRKLRFEAKTGGTVLEQPNTYVNEYQKEETFKCMTSLGWTFNEDNGVWYKYPIKNKKGEFLALKKKRKK